MKKLLFFATVLGFGLFSFDSSAQLFKLTTSNYGAFAGNAALRNAWDAALVEIESEVNKDFPSTENPRRLMQGMANSSVMAGKGIGSDYASRMEVFLIGAGVGVGADMKKDKQTDSDLSGVGVQGGLVIGTNLSWMDAEKILGLYTDRLNVYANWLSYDLEQKMGDGDKDEINGDLTSFGFHVSYDLVKPVGHSILRWGGIKVHTGYEYNSTRLTFNTSLSEDVDENIGGIGNDDHVRGKIQGRPEATIDVATQSIPLEISTNVQLLYFISLYTGLGVDFNFGKAKGDGALNADPTTLRYDTDGDATNGDAGAGATVQAEANINGSGKVDSILTRGFAGVQLNLPYVNIFAQVDKAFGNELIGATGGIRFVY
jgi:hypothetical protein